MASARGQISVGDNTAVDPSNYDPLGSGTNPAIPVPQAGGGYGSYGPYIGYVPEGYSGAVYNYVDPYSGTVHTVANSNIPTSDPGVVKPSTPLDEVQTLLDLFHSQFAPASAAPLGPAAAPGVTVIPADQTADSSAGGGSQIFLILAVLGIVVTLGLHFWEAHKHKEK
jgi:hypothetical protein